MVDSSDGFPQPNTNEAINVIGNAIDDLLHQLPFRFTNGDVMSAALYLVVECGLNSATPEQLKQDIIESLDNVIAGVMAENKKNMN